MYQSVEDVTDIKLNPFSEIIRCAQEHHLEGMYTGMKIDDWFARDAKGRDQWFEDMSKRVEPFGYTVIKNTDKTTSTNFVYSYCKDGKILMNIIMFTRDGYGKEEEGKRFNTCEMNFTEWDVFDFIKCGKEHNFFDFASNGMVEGTMDLVGAILLAFSDFDTYIREYKAKSLVVKNVMLLADKLVKPICETYDVTFRPNVLIAAALHGKKLYCREIPYDGYAANFKDYVVKLKEHVDADNAAAAAGK